MVLAGDGWDDSPAPSAKYSVSTLMEHYLNLIVDIDRGNCEEGNWWYISYNGETGVEATGWENNVPMTELKIVDVLTDASSVIIALIRTVKGKPILNKYV